MSFLQRILSPRPAAAAGRALYIAAVGQSRRPDFYSRLGVADSLEGRFELYTLHVALLVDRLATDPEAKEASQAMFDAYLHGLDDALRDEGVGDLSVGKKMRKLGEAFYGRVKSYEEALAGLPDEAPLEGVLARTVFAGADDAPTAPFAAYVLRQRAHLAGQPLDALMAGTVDWSPA